MNRAVIGLGTNLGDRMGSLRAAVKSLALLPGTSVARYSSIYQTAPVGLTSQPYFFNCAVAIETALSARALLGACLGIEAAMGRVRAEKNGPRVIDLDLLFYEGVRCCDAELTLPHPRIPERLFVLVPLRELFPGGEALGFPFDTHQAPDERVELFCAPQRLLS